MAKKLKLTEDLEKEPEFQDPDIKLEEEDDEYWLLDHEYEDQWGAYE
ncbi:MAG TPA: hypothetical protein VNJ08_14845 [Bacteriovoracaceae bacterium]|nr:hypothetical protein [Bacteriovoracaceae bacterium]